LAYTLARTDLSLGPGLGRDPVQGYVCVYGVSANTRSWWDLPPSLGYLPLDDAEDYAGDVEPDDGIPFQGGPSTARESGGWAVSP
jgi:uronate dehydrogenase